jgi:hypothetical protein
MNRKQTISKELRYEINHSNRQFPDDAAIAGDIRVKLGFDIFELLSIQIRAVTCSVDKAKEKWGMDWWVNNPVFRKDKQKDIAPPIRSRSLAARTTRSLILRPDARQSRHNFAD